MTRDNAGLSVYGCATLTCFVPHKPVKYTGLHGVELYITKHYMAIGCEAQLASKCLFTPTFFAGEFDA